MSPQKPHKPNVLDELRSQIGKAMPPAAHAAEPAAHAEPKAPAAARERKPQAGRPAKAAKKEVAQTPSSGRGVHFYVDDGDRRILNSLAVWFGSQDRRMSDSQVIKAAIRLAAAHQGAKLLELADEVRASDRRRNPKTERKRAD